MDPSSAGRLIFFAGLCLAVLGALVWLVGKVPFHLPGDFAFRIGNTRIYLPLASSLLLSVVVTLLLNWLARR